MTPILTEIQRWSEKLPSWQQHAIALLYENPDLSVSDLDDTYALLKAEHGIGPDKEISRRTLNKSQIAVPSSSQSAVVLLSIKDLKSVNALAEGKMLPISATGLTVIYGENGVGKSGYSRVLKQACRARDQSEKVRGNVYADYLFQDIPSAKFDVTVNGEPAEFSWKQGSTPPVELSAIAIFDSHCARAYVDNHGDFAYAPYGLDILESLAKVCTHLKDRLNGELRSQQPQTQIFHSLAQTSTEVGRLLQSLSAKTRKEEVDRLGTLTQTELQRLQTLVQTLSESDPRKKAADLNARAQRIDGLSRRVADIENGLSEQRIANLQSLIKKSDVAKVAAQAAAERFATAGGLDGTGNEAWVEMFQAARVFCATSGPVNSFPRLPSDANCPLCQNTLGSEGASRLAAFDDFIQGQASSLAASARKNAVAAFRAIVDLVLDLGLDEALKHDLESHPLLFDSCTTWQVAVRKRQEATRTAATPGSGIFWDDLPPMTKSPAGDLVKVASELREAAKVLEKTMSAQDRTAMQVELEELKARVQLSELKTAAFDALEKYAHAERLAKCVTATSTAGISRKSTELTGNMATKEVAEALNRELQALGVNEIKVAMKPTSSKAKTTFKLVLENDAGVSPIDILSEGEQRAIAIASFLTEVRLSNGPGGVVLDDPVSSLDHARRERVASRLVAESAVRQVVVFTHDLFFLSVLMEEASAQGLDATAQTLNRTTDGYGVADSGLPFAGAAVRARVGILRNKQVNCARLYKAGDQAAYRLHTRDFYNDLRMTWERAVEELLFNGVVVRFRKSIQTNRLDRVEITTDDLAVINAGMTVCSNYTGHDAAIDSILAVPLPQDMTEHLDALESWRKAIIERQKR